MTADAPCLLDLPTGNVRAADRASPGALDAHFPLFVRQTGSGVDAAMFAATVDPRRMV